jgi:FMN-dependent NADH-azoreductase
MSTKLLHIDSSILGENSVSRSLSASVVATLRAAIADLDVTYRDLAANPLPHLSGITFAAGRGADVPRDAALQADLDLGATVLDELLEADIVVLGLGFYNFGIPSQLKAWVDRLAVPGKTFRYTEKGPQGLLSGKRIIVTVARGGYYGPGTPAHALEHAESYLRGLFAFFGIAQIEVVAAEGLAVGPQVREASIAQAQASIAALAAG